MDGCPLLSPYITVCAFDCTKKPHPQRCSLAVEARDVTVRAHLRHVEGDVVAPGDARNLLVPACHTARPSVGPPQTRFPWRDDLAGDGPIGSTVVAERDAIGPQEDMALRPWSDLTVDVNASCTPAPATMGERGAHDRGPKREVTPPVLLGAPLGAAPSPGRRIRACYTTGGCYFCWCRRRASHTPRRRSDSP